VQVKPTPSIQKRLIPSELIDAYASLFDDPAYSDVVFHIRSPKHKQGQRVRKLYASRKVLAARADYFRDMFSGDFAEGASLVLSDEGSDDGGGSERMSVDGDSDAYEDDNDLEASSEGESGEGEEEGDDEEEEDDNDGRELHGVSMSRAREKRILISC
jgi:BTB/POZ domain